MGILRALFDNEWLLRHDIERVAGRLARQSNVVHMQAAELRRRVAQLEDESAELTLLVRALYAYLKQSDGFDAERFAAIVTEIDARDGVVDGKARPPRRQVVKARRR